MHQVLTGPCHDSWDQNLLRMKRKLHGIRLKTMSLKHPNTPSLPESYVRGNPKNHFYFNTPRMLFCPSSDSKDSLEVLYGSQHVLQHMVFTKSGDTHTKSSVSFRCFLQQNLSTSEYNVQPAGFLWPWGPGWLYFCLNLCLRVQF